jgi:hypothetical protein
MGVPRLLRALPNPQMTHFRHRKELCAPVAALRLREHALTSPDEVRHSRRDPRVLLFYRREDPYWLVADARRLNGDGFLITAYRTDTRIQ